MWKDIFFALVFYHSLESKNLYFLSRFFDLILNDSFDEQTAIELTYYILKCQENLNSLGFYITAHSFLKYFDPQYAKNKTQARQLMFVKDILKNVIDLLPIEEKDKEYINIFHKKMKNRDELLDNTNDYENLLIIDSVYIDSIMNIILDNVKVDVYQKYMNFINEINKLFYNMCMRVSNLEKREIDDFVDLCNINLYMNFLYGIAIGKTKTYNQELFVSLFKEEEVETQMIQCLLDFNLLKQTKKNIKQAIDKIKDEDAEYNLMYILCLNKLLTDEISLYCFSEDDILNKNDIETNLKDWEAKMIEKIPVQFQENYFQMKERFKNINLREIKFDDVTGLSNSELLVMSKLMTYITLMNLSEMIDNEKQIENFKEIMKISASINLRLKNDMIENNINLKTKLNNYFYTIQNQKKIYLLNGILIGKSQ
ncbi:MAG: hypothetical protein N2505_00285 [Endomicrobia bacterium]|nr:hypothetical protein [Endomicrobiia bacterium]